MIKKIVPILPLYGAGIVVAGALKFFYSHAGPDELNWILGPTTRFVEILSGIHFEREFRVGWISHSGRMIVGPSCAGLNFLIIAFSTLLFTLGHRHGGLKARSAWLAASLGMAYLLAIAANALRILVAIILFDANIYGGFVTPERVHRVEGVMVYSLSLLLFFLALERTAWLWGPRKERWTSSPLVPLVWYLSITIGVPLLNRAYLSDPSAFLEHAVSVVSIGLAIALAGVSLRWAVTKIGYRPAVRGG